MWQTIKKMLGFTGQPEGEIPFDALSNQQRIRTRIVPKLPAEKYAARPPIREEQRRAFEPLAAQRQPPSNVFEALNVPPDSTDDTLIRMLSTDATNGHREWPTFDTPPVFTPGGGDSGGSGASSTFDDTSYQSSYDSSSSYDTSSYSNND